jgi:hypothetical protein
MTNESIEWENMLRPLRTARHQVAAPAELAAAERLETHTKVWADPS